MIELLDKVYTAIKGRGKIQGAARFILRIISNKLIPIYFFFFSSKKSYKKRLKAISKKRIVVSITTFPARIDKIWIVIECIFRQTLAPNIIVLYLSEEQFPGKMKDLPKKLKRYSSEGLIIIKFVKDDLRSHKKYFYSFQEYLNDLVVLIDDDLIYTKKVIEILVKLQVEYPLSICCHRGHLVKKDATGNLLKYKDWKVIKAATQPSHSIFHTSGGGTIYNPSLFNEDLLNVALIKNLCFHADDVWLNIHAHLSNLKIVKSDYFTDYIPILNRNDLKLSDLNVKLGENDIQIKKTLEFYDIHEKDIFAD